MRNSVFAIVLALAVVSLVSCLHHPTLDEKRGESPDTPREKQDLPPPLGQTVADNSWCHVCHINYAQEELAVTHARANVGCATCHGESYPHRGDEANVTPPDIMYPKEKINPSCLKCHAAEKLSDIHKPILAGAADEKYCTDCHGEHRLAYRTQRWDKATGKRLKQE